MSVRVDTASLIPGAIVVGDRGLGVTGATIRTNTAIGTNGSGYLYNDWDDSEDDNREFRGEIVTLPSSGTLTANEDGSFSLVDAVDGSYTFTYRLYVDGVDLGTATVAMNIGNITVFPSLFSNSPTFYVHVLDQPTSAYRPSGDISTGGWTATPGGTLASCIDEVVANDSDYITSPNLTTPAVLSLSTSLPAGSWDISVRAKYVLTNGQIRIRMLNSGGTDVGGSSWQVLTGSASTYTLSATTTAAADRFRIEVQ